MTLQQDNSLHAPTAGHCLIVLGVMLLASAGCQKNTADQPVDKQQPAALWLYCGAGLRPAVQEIAEAFTRQSGTVVECDYAGSGMLISRIRAGRKGDLFLPGDVWYVDELASYGSVESKRTVAYLEPVIITAKGNDKGISALVDLAKPNVRLGLGNPAACQIGRVCQSLFEKNGIDTEAINQNLVFSSMTVNELGLQLVAGRIDASIVWNAIAAYYADRVDVVRIPSAQNQISPVAIGLLSVSQNKQAAKEFIEFICSSQAERILAKHHYRTQPASLEDAPSDVP